MLMLAEPKEIRLRDYQAEAIEAMRVEIRAGKKRIILCAGTGAGKTLTSAHLLTEASRKGSYSLFIVDRVALVDQTSDVFDEYGIRHGIVQGINDRWAPNEHVQVCSAQTLARRSLPRSPSLIVVDEAHCQYKATLDFMARYPDAVKIGLTATPFTPGMGKHWDTMVNVRSTRLLIDDGHLIEPTIYVAKSPDDADLGLNSYGEFSDESATTAGIRIVGDVVQEWVRKTQEHFGGPVKTIVFSPTVEHGREVCAAFGAAGFNFQQISYMDRSEDERKQKIEEFRRPDSVIHGLVSCGVLTKGFDVPDVKCIASGQRVLTDNGLVPIEKVTLEHRLWDGIEYVSHQGVIFKGYRNVIEHDGIVATPDHEVWTAQGWRTLGDCAAKQIGIAQTGFGERAVRWDEGHFTGNRVEESRSVEARSRPVRVRGLRLALRQGLNQFAGIPPERMPWLLHGKGRGSADRCPGLVDTPCSQHESALHAAVSSSLRGLRRTWDRVSVSLANILRDLGHAELRTAATGQEYAVGQDRQRRALRARQFALGFQGVELREHPPRRVGGDDASFQDRAPGDPLRGQDVAQPVHDGLDLRAGGRALLPAVRQAKRPVWDILQAGPRNRFTCEGLLVHNCGISCRPYRKSLSSHMQEIGRVMRPHPGKIKALWLDHAGNIERFAFDMFDVWDNGAGDLSKAEKRDKEPRTRDDVTREKAVCPECSGALRGNFCMACGWERPARSGIVAVEGSLQEFDPKALGLTARAGLRAECLKDPRAVWTAALGYCLDHCPRDEGKARRWAYGVWRGIFPGAKLPSGWFESTRRPCDQNAYALVDREVKRFRKNNKRGPK